MVEEEEDGAGVGVEDVLVLPMLELDGIFELELEGPFELEVEPPGGNGMIGVGDDEDAVDCGVGVGGLEKEGKEGTLLPPLGIGANVVNVGNVESVGDDEEKGGGTIGVGAAWTVSVTVTVTVTVTGSGMKVTVTGSGVGCGASLVGAGVGPAVSTGDSEPPYV